MAGWLLGMHAAQSNLANWQIARHALGVRELPNFVTVAYIHNATYLGAAIGTLLAIVDVCRARLKLRQMAALSHESGNQSQLFPRLLAR
jgi:hypothetical protein